jgi:hypothetical protein
MAYEAGGERVLMDSIWARSRSFSSPMHDYLSFVMPGSCDRGERSEGGGSQRALGSDGRG